MNNISITELKSLLDQNPSLPVIDVRTPLEFDEAHIPESRNIPLGTLAPKRLIDNGELPERDPIYILCRSGRRSAKAAEQFLAAGYTNPVVVEGGTLAWIAADLPVKQGAAHNISLERQIRIAAGAIALAGVLLGWTAHPVFFGVSGIVGAGLVFAGITGWCGMGLLLAKAPWNQRHRS